MLLVGRLTDPARLQRFHRRMDELTAVAQRTTRTGALTIAAAAGVALATTLAAAG